MGVSSTSAYTILSRVWAELLLFNSTTVIFVLRRVSIASEGGPSERVGAINAPRRRRR